MAKLSRRQFLQASVAGTLTLGFVRLACSTPQAEPVRAKTPALSPYGDWRDLYREKLAWDRVVHGTHTGANCVGGCAWNLYVRNELVMFEEQAASYPAANEHIPDWNPRGCQKGACYSNVSYGPTRVSYPLKRVGPRGAGSWKRISWDEALDEIAAEMVATLEKRGGEGIVCELGSNIDYGPSTAAAWRFFGQIGAPMTDIAAQTGDLPVGGTMTLGLPFTGGSSDDWFRSEYLVMWAFNPSVTRIPDAHYLNEARYRGARVVSITPDYCQSAIHSDLWLAPRPGTDAALALAACQVVIEESLYQADYVREQTDLPFLVRMDTRRFLRESDVVEGGSDDVFAVWDDGTGQPAWAPGSMGSSKKTLLVPAGIIPALEARAEVRLASGEVVPVRTVFSLVRERLAHFRPEDAGEITGVAPETIRRFAREFARARSALIIAEFGMCKHYHSDLMQRSQILLSSLTGNLGRAGGGWRSGGFIALDGLGLMAMQDDLDIFHLIATAVSSFMDPKAVMAKFDDLFISGTLFHAVHGGLADLQTGPMHGDPTLPRGAQPYLEEALEKGHFPVAPAPGADPPEILFSIFGNVLRHSKSGHRIRDTLFATARLIVDITFRMSETARHADILLPAATWYEKIGVKAVPVLSPYAVLGDRAVAPLNEAKSEWEIFSRLSERVAAAARARGVIEVNGFRGEPRAIDRLDERFSDAGRFGLDSEEAVQDFMLSVSSAFKGIDVEALRGKGAIRLSGLGPQGASAGVFSDHDTEVPISPLGDFVEKKQPYPTLTGRQQFYIDHPWFLELGEELPTHKDPPAIGGDHPLRLTNGHARWSIHSTWRDNALMLRLQRGEPVVLLNAADANARGIRDHDLVSIWNDVGRFRAHAKIAPVQPGQVHMFHAWEPYQFRDGKCHQEVAPSPLKVTQLVGNYGHLQWGFARYDVNQVDRCTRVDVARA